jgi:Domain of unknown function (DUF4139)/N-terminal domain of unknown function (DUF4140)
MRYSLLFFFLFIIEGLLAQSTKINTTTLDSVTVFLDGAQVQRHAQLNLVKGRNEFEIMQLSPHIDPSSISITLQQPHVLQGVSFRHEFIDKASVEERTASLKKQIVDLKDSLHLLQIEQRVLMHLESLLTQNLEIGGSAIGVSTDELAKAFEFHRVQLSDIKNKLYGINHVFQAIVTDTLDLHLQINSLGNRKDQFTGVIVLVVDAMNSGIAQVDMSYMVSGASWFPSYDMRASDVSQPIELTFKANVSQKTGENWENVKMTLATGTPSNAINPPTIVPWWLSRNSLSQKNTVAGIKNIDNRDATFSGNKRDLAVNSDLNLQLVDAVTGEALSGATVLVSGKTIGTTTDMNGRARLILPAFCNEIQISYVGYDQQFLSITNQYVYVRMWANGQIREDLLIKSVEAGNISLKGSRSNGTNYYIDGIRVYGNLPPPNEEVMLMMSSSQTNTGSSYKIKELFTLPSDGKSYMAELSRVDIDASFKHYCVPRIDPAVYVLAVVTDWEHFGLLDGQANVYYENTYVGQTLVQSSSTNDTLELALGRDRLITVERKLAKDKSSRGTFNGRRSVNRTWELTANSQRNTPITLEIVEQYPISAEKGIEVELNETSGAANNPELGTLTWKIPLAIGQREKRTVAYKVIAPRGVAFQL